MTESVPVLSMIFMAVSLILSFALPIGLCIYFRKVKKADLLPFFVGMAVMVLFAFVLERLVHSVVLGSSVGAKIQANMWLYALYGGLMAGLFEETGRFLAFKTVLKKNQKKDVNSLMYGAGHGGIEAVLILGIASINNLIYSVLINTDATAVLTGSLSGDLLQQVETAIQTLITTPSLQFLLGGVERIFAIVLHIALSVLVWFAVKKAGKGYLYPVAILIHFIVDAATVILSRIGASTLVLEAVIGVLAVAAALFAKVIWNKEKTDPYPAS